jgi:hypothetical protein
MRTHTYSIAIAHLQSGDWTVAIVRSTFRRGVEVDSLLVRGPVWLPEVRLAEYVLRATQELQKLVREQEAAQPA